MKALFAGLDWILNLRGLIGYRTVILRALGIGVAAYAWVSTAPAITVLLDLPDLPTEAISGVAAYVAAQLPKFTKEHKPS